MQGRGGAVGRGGGREGGEREEREGGGGTGLSGFEWAREWGRSRRGCRVGGPFCEVDAVLGGLLLTCLLIDGGREEGGVVGGVVERTGMDEAVEAGRRGCVVEGRRLGSCVAGSALLEDCTFTGSLFA